MSNFAEEYERLAHAVQTGVAHDHAAGSQDGSPKHLRVGINMRAVDHAALVRLLIDKKVITSEEYEAAVLEECSKEVVRYEDRLKERYGATIKLH